MTPVALLVASVVLQSAYNPSGPVIVVKFENGKQFEITADIVGSPKTTEHICDLTKRHFYDGIRFHRVENWVVQWGDPLTKKGLDLPGVGDGGSGKDIEFETSKAIYVRGMVGIASEGLKLGGDSQLFVLKSDALRLNGNYAVLGKVTKGMEVVDSIQKGDRVVAMYTKTPWKPDDPKTEGPRRVR